MIKFLKHKISKQWKQAICLFVLMLVCSISATVWSQQQREIEARLNVVTDTPANVSLRNPAFALVQDAGTQKPYLLWNRGFVDKAAGKVVMEPRQSYWSLLSAIAIESVDFPKSTFPLEFHYGQQGASPSSSDFTVINGSLAGNIGNQNNARRLKTPLVAHPLIEGGGYSSTHHVAFRQIIREQKTGNTKIEAEIYSELPVDSKDPQYLNAIRKYKEGLEEVARSTGGKVIDAKDWIAKRVKPQPNDVIYISKRVWSSLDFFRFQGSQSSTGIVWLVGIDRLLANTDTPQDYLWVMQSKDGAKTWDARKLIGRGNYPTIVSAKNGDLLVFSTQTKQFGWQGEWPANAPDAQTPSRNWPGYGTLMMQRSGDQGKNWSKATQVFDDKLVIQNRVYRAPDGKLWLVYVQSDAQQRQRTSLWLSSSVDNGKTWKKPQQLTDGKTLDREPDLIWHEGKLLIAFSRAGRAINTNIWVATVTPQ